MHKICSKLGFLVNLSEDQDTGNKNIKQKGVIIDKNMQVNCEDVLFWRLYQQNNSVSDNSYIFYPHKLNCTS